METFSAFLSSCGRENRLGTPGMWEVEIPDRCIPVPVLHKEREGMFVGCLKEFEEAISIRGKRKPTFKSKAVFQKCCELHCKTHSIAEHKLFGSCSHLWDDHPVSSSVHRPPQLPAKQLCICAVIVVVEFLFRTTEVNFIVLWELLHLGSRQLYPWCKGQTMPFISMCENAHVWNNRADTRGLSNYQMVRLFCFLK